MRNHPLFIGLTAYLMLAIIVTSYSATAYDSMDNQYVTAKDGSASAPGITFSSETDVGLYRNGSNSIGIAAGASNGIYNSGNNWAFYSTNNQYGLRNNTVEGSDDGAFVIGAAGILTSTRTAQLLGYGQDNTQWPGLILAVPVTDPITVPTIPTGTQQWSDATAPVSLDGHVTVRKNLLVNGGYGLTWNSDNVWSCRTPAAGIHVLTEQLLCKDMYNFTVETADTALVIEGGDNAYQEIWSEGAASEAGIKFRSVDVAAGTGKLAYVSPSAGNAYLSATVGGTEMWRTQDNGDLTLFGKTSSNVAVAGVEVQNTGLVQSTRASNLALRLNRTGSAGVIAELRDDGTNVGTLETDGSNLVIGFANGSIIATGSASPESAVAAGPGSIFMRTNGLNSLGLYFKESGTGSTGWRSLPSMLYGSATIDFVNTGAGGSTTQTVTLTGAQVGDVVALGFGSTPTVGIAWDAWVSAANTISIRGYNMTGSSIDPASTLFTYHVVRR